ncbi:MAG: hydrogenase [Candidatus Thermoplasmatota archaeon]
MNLVESLLEKFSTGSGFWHPILWILAFVFIFLLIYVLRMFGRKDYKKNTDQEQPFLSGNIEYSSDQTHVTASNLYWGFIHSMRSVYTVVTKIHTGDARDYVIWFTIILAVLFVILEVI